MVAVGASGCGEARRGRSDHERLDISGPAPTVKSGYELDLDSENPATGTSCNGGSLVITYHVTADPLPGKGKRYFGTNAAGAIFQSVATLYGDMPDTGMPAAPAMPIQQ